MNYSGHFEALRQIYEVPQNSGFIETYLTNVRFFWSTEHVPRAPLPHCRGIIIIGQGHKVGFLNGREFRYDENHYLISSVPTSYECETFASEDKPVLGILIDFDLSRLSEIVEKIQSHHPEIVSSQEAVTYGVEPIELSSMMQQATGRLLDCLQSKMDSDVLGQGIIDEILYCALLSKHGHALADLTRQDTQYARIAQSLTHIHENYMNNILVAELAEISHMSLSSFHRAFKVVTGETPLQYLKKVRLNQARFLIIREGLRVNTAAARVGYDSVSQFSREFKRHFEISPSAAQSGAYSAMFS